MVNKQITSSPVMVFSSEKVLNTLKKFWKVHFKEKKSNVKNLTAI